MKFITQDWEDLLNLKKVDFGAINRERKELFDEGNIIIEKIRALRSIIQNPCLVSREDYKEFEEIFEELQNELSEYIKELDDFVIENMLEEE